MHHDLKNGRQKIHFKLTQYDDNLPLQVIQVLKVNNLGTYCIKEKTKSNNGMSHILR